MTDPGASRRPPWPADPGRSSWLDPPAASATRLRGRGPEMDALREALDRVAAGRPALALIEGEAGIGKTRLLDTVLEDAVARGMQVARGRAEELEQNRPFGLVAAAFGCVRTSDDPRRKAIADLLASSVGGGPITVTSDPGLQFQAVDAFADLVEALALAGPLVVGLDDLQWADESSLLTLGALVRRMAGLPVAVLGCLRPLPRSTDLDRFTGRLFETDGARRIWLAPLSAAAVHDLVADAVAAEPGPALLTEAAGAGGNPLFVTELVGALMQEGTVQIAGGRAEVAHATLPPTLRLTVLRRLSFLSDGTIEALRAASILGSSFSLTDLVTVTGGSARELSVALTEAVQAGVVADDGQRLRFRHDLIRDAIYEDLPGSVRLGLHREAGLRLGAAGAPALQVAEHLARGARPGDSEAIRWLTQAAREAVATSPDSAARLLARAVDLMSPADPGRDRLLVLRVGSLMWAGRLAEAEATSRALLDRGHDPSVACLVRLSLAQALLATGWARAALRELQQAVCSTDGGDLAAAQAWESFAHLSLGDLDSAWSAGTEARSAADQVDDHLATSVATTSLALTAEQRGDLALALRLAGDALSRADHSPARLGHRYTVRGVHGLILTDLDRFDEARSTLQAGARIAEELGIRLHLSSYQVFLAFEAFAAGDWDEALADAQVGLELAEEVGETYTRVWCQSLRSLILVHRNDLRGARDAADTAVAELSGTGPRYRSHWAHWARALVLEADGQAGEAYAVMAECWDWCAGLGLTMDYGMLGPDLVRLALGGHDRDRARAVAAAVTGLAERNQVPSLSGAALRCRGLADDDAETLAAAVRAYQPGARPLELAGACADAGAAFARLGQADQARALIEQALEIYENLDAGRDVARVEAGLREAGIRRGRRGPRGRPQSGWLSLTPAEQTVASLVADGLSNPQIGDRLYISRRTVQAHLAHVFAKLGIASRAQLAAQVTARSRPRPRGGPGR
jgi:DNA-binding CsgD family transcriptional regulator